VGILELMVSLAMAAFLAAALVGASRTLVKAGYAGWWALLLLVPLVNLVAIYAFGSADWPVLRRLRALEGAGGHSRQGGDAGGIQARRGGGQARRLT